MNGISLKAGRVFFLYEEERAAMAFVRENKDVPVVVFYTFFVGKARQFVLFHRIRVNPFQGAFFEDFSETPQRRRGKGISSKIPGG